MSDSPEEAAADLARLATLVAHEMRTPLSVVSGYMKMLAGERQGPLTEAQRRSVAGADRACQQLIALAADMSWLGRIGRGEVSPNPTPVALNSLLAELAAAHTPIDEHPVYVESGAGTAADAATLTIEADAVNLRRVLTSLLAAVVRGAPDEATVRLLARRGNSGAVAVAVAPIALIDELLAADPETLDAVDEATGGLGVGLPLARRLLALEGGAIRARATPQGLGILVTLPG
jgi:signal transduction histidine kinase